MSNYVSFALFRVSNQEEHNAYSYGGNKISSLSLERITRKSDKRVNDVPVQTGTRSDVHLSTIIPSPKYSEDMDLNRLGVKERNLNSPLGFGPNMGFLSSGQTNWNNFPNWLPYLASGGYMPFHHVPPPNFNPVAQQFRPPLFPSFFGRPPVNMNHVGMPFTGHGNPIAWSNQVAIPPPLHMWESNNVVFDDGSHGNWDNDRTQMNHKTVESSAYMESGAQKIDHSLHAPTDDFLFAQTSQHSENEQSGLDIQAETTNNTPIVMKPTEVDDTCISRAYLSKIDISKDLNRPEPYDQCTLMLGLGKESVSDEFDCRILFLEEGVEDDITKGASLFSAIDDSVYKKAMSLYTKQKDDAKLVEDAFEGAVFDESKI